MSLPYTEEEQLDLMDLAGEAAQDAQKTADEILNFRQEADLNKEKISKLTEQLKGLEEAKLEHENALLAKFSQLLNAKKLKIRDQQRLLAGASVDPDAGKFCTSPSPAEGQGHLCTRYLFRFVYISQRPKCKRREIERRGLAQQENPPSRRERPVRAPVTPSPTAHQMLLKTLI